MIFFCFRHFVRLPDEEKEVEMGYGKEEPGLLFLIKFSTSGIAFLPFSLDRSILIISSYTVTGMYPGFQLWVFLWTSF